AVALESIAQLLEQVDLGALAQLMGRFAFKLARQILELLAQSLCLLKCLGPLGEDGCVFLLLEGCKARLNGCILRCLESGYLRLCTGLGLLGLGELPLKV